MKKGKALAGKRYSVVIWVCLGLVSIVSVLGAFQAVVIRAELLNNTNLLVESMYQGEAVTVTGDVDFSESFSVIGSAFPAGSGPWISGTTLLIPMDTTTILKMNETLILSGVLAVVLLILILLVRKYSKNLYKKAHIYVIAGVFWANLVGFYAVMNSI